MALTPAATDPKRDEELKRLEREPHTFGIGGARSAAVAKKVTKTPPPPPADGKK